MWGKVYGPRMDRIADEIEKRGRGPGFRRRNTHGDKFARGECGPLRGAGRPPNVRASLALTRILEREANAVARRVIADALNGNVVAQ